MHPDSSKLVLESLRRLQERLTTRWNPLVRCFWDEGHGRIPRPKDENFFSDFVCDHLNRDLKGVAAQREVDARNRRGRSLGERTDIAVTATSTAAAGAIDSVGVIIECKGCWNKALETAMADQLKQQYLIDEGHRCGLYPVGWFKCEAWDDKSDSRQVPCGTFDEAVGRFDAQADALSDGTYSLRAFVIDVCLPSIKTG